MHTWLSIQAAARPNALALLADGITLTYRDLHTRSVAMAAALAARGVVAGARVGVLLGNTPDAGVAIHALMHLGATLVMLNTRLTVAELAPQAKRARCSHVLYDADSMVLAVALDAVPLLIEALPENDAPVDAADVDLDALAVIMFTSGSSGAPKGVELSWGNFWHSAMASAYRIGALPGDRWLCTLPLFHVGGLSILLRACLYGAAVDLWRKFDAEAIHTALMTQPVTQISLVPTQLYRLLELRGEHDRYPALRVMLLGGSGASAELLARASQAELPVVVTYGLTEAASQVATAWPGETSAKPEAVGRPLSFTELRIVKDDGSLCAAGEFGEVTVRGPTVMRRYLDDPAATGKTLRNGWLHTGDIGLLDAEGDLHILQRRNDLIVSGGENVYPAEVERVLRTHPQVAEAVVVGLDSAEWGQQVAALIVMRREFSGSDASTLMRISQFARERLAGYKVPRVLRMAESLPQIASGKLDRAAVRDCLSQPPARTARFRVNGLGYHIESSGDGPPLLLLHGFTGSLRNWDALTDVLAATHRVIRVDLPGHGATELPQHPKRASMAQVADDLCALLRALDAAPAHVLGYSMGARLALNLALQHPECVARLVLESGSPGLKTEDERASRRASDEAQAQRIEADGVEAFVDAWETLPLWSTQKTLGDDARAHLRQLRMQNTAVGLALSLRAMGAGTQASLWPQLEQLRAPTLLITGFEDGKFDMIAREMHAAAPHLRHESVMNAGHAVHLEAPATYAQIVKQFLEHAA